MAEHSSEIPDWVVCPLCGGELVRAGEYVAYVLSIVVAELILVKNTVGKYTCKRCGFSTGGSCGGDSAGMPVRQEQAGACSPDASSSSQADGAGVDRASKDGTAGAEAGLESKAEDGAGTQPGPKAGGPGPEPPVPPREERAPEVSPAFAELLRQHGCHPCPPWLRPAFAPGKRGYNAMHWPGIAVAPHCSAAPWLAAHVAVRKYGFGIPLYR